MPEPVPDLPVMEFASAKAWETWLRKHHDSSDGVWLKVAKKGTGVVTVSMPDVPVRWTTLCSTTAPRMLVRYIPLQPYGVAAWVM